MLKGQTSLGGVLIVIMGISLITVFFLRNYYPLKLEEQAYLKQYNQILLLNTLKYSDAENISVVELLSARTCGKDTNPSGLISEVMEEMMKPGYDFIFQAGDLLVYSSAPRVKLEEIFPAKVVLETYCGNNLTIVAGAYYEKRIG
jgi:hypothetical protein